MSVGRELMAVCRFPDCAGVPRHKIRGESSFITWLGNCGVPVSLRKNLSWALIKWLLAESSRTRAHGRRQPMSFIECFFFDFSVSVSAIAVSGTPEQFRIRETISEQRHLKLKISWPAQPAPGRKVSANLRSPHTLMRSWMT